MPSDFRCPALSSCLQGRSAVGWYSRPNHPTIRPTQTHEHTDTHTHTLHCTHTHYTAHTHHTGSSTCVCACCSFTDCRLQPHLLASTGYCTATCTPLFASPGACPEYTSKQGPLTTATVWDNAGMSSGT